MVFLVYQKIVGYYVCIKFRSFFLYTQRDYDNIAVLWISPGSTITLLTLLMQLTDHKPTMIIYITRKFKLLYYSSSFAY